MCMCVLACIRARAPDTLSRIISVTSLEITCKYIIQGFARLLLLELCPATARLLSLSVCNEAAMGPRGRSSNRGNTFRILDYIIVHNAVQRFALEFWKGIFAT